MRARSRLNMGAHHHIRLQSILLSTMVLPTSGESTCYEGSEVANVPPLYTQPPAVLQFIEVTAVAAFQRGLRLMSHCGT